MIDAHMEVWRMESASLEGDTFERRWLAWIELAEKILGFDLDGDLNTDGCALDDAHDRFAEGKTAHEYAQLVRDRRRAFNV